LEKISADVYARYRRLAGDRVHFLMGMDEHGQKVAQAAAARGVSPQEQVDHIATLFTTVWSRLGVSYDQFIRTTSPAHQAGVTALLERIFVHSPDAFYERSYEGWYCVGCEAFKTDAEIENGKCLLHPTRTLEWVTERNWFFRLSAYSDMLRAHFVAHPEFIYPDSRRNEIVSLLDRGLEDVSASRARQSWGIPFPRATSDGVQQTTYVWFDALPNYLTATGFPAPGYEDRWPADVHFVGKDITRFHCVIWPAMLHAAGLPLPRAVWAHGFVTASGDKLSKSAGVRIDLADAIDRHGPDAFRYFLMREVPFNGDGEFSMERLDERYVADLANAFGNLASRSIAMVERYRDGIVPSAPDAMILAADSVDYARYHEHMGAPLYLPHEALRAVWSTVARGNEYVDREAPWKLAKDPAQHRALDTVLATLVHQLAEQAIHLAPFIPDRAEALWHQLGAPGSVHDQRFGTGVDATGWRVAKGDPLFPKARD
jgi:methionyl-tRNA synthetase